MGRTGIIGAMEEEVALLKEKMEIEVEFLRLCAWLNWP